MEAVHEAADAGCPFFAWLREHIARSSSPIERLLQVKMKFILNSSRENLADVYRCDLVVRMTDGQRHYLLPMPSLDVESDEGEFHEQRWQSLELKSFQGRPPQNQRFSEPSMVART